MAVARKVETESFVQTEVGPLPSDWHLNSISNMSTSVSSGRSHVDCDYGGVPVYGSTGIIGSCRKGEYAGTSILIARVGANAGKLAVVEGAYGVTDNTIIVKIKDTFELQYIWRQLEVKKLNSLVFGSGQPLLTGTQIKNLIIPLPPTKAEQEAIATALSDADALIESIEQLIAKKRQIKQGAMQELLTGKRRLPGVATTRTYIETDVGKIPTDWRVVSVAEISIVGRGRVISHREIEKALTPLYPVYSSQTSNDGIMGYLDTYDFEGEFITWTTDGANAGTVFYRNGKFNCTNVCGTIKLRSESYSFIAKVLSCFTYPHVSRHLGNPKLMNDIMKKIRIPIPPTIAEQNAIASIIDDIEVEENELESKLTKARQLKQGMMQELLTGRIRLI